MEALFAANILILGEYRDVLKHDEALRGSAVGFNRIVLMITRYTQLYAYFTA